MTDCRECERKLEEIERLWGRIDQPKSEVASLEDDGINSYDRIDLDLPFTYLDALVYYSTVS